MIIQAVSPVLMDGAGDGAEAGTTAATTVFTVSAAVVALSGGCASEYAIKARTNPVTIAKNAFFIIESSCSAVTGGLTKFFPQLNNYVVVQVFPFC
jgi:hypothetical protein